MLRFPGRARKKETRRQSAVAAKGAIGVLVVKDTGCSVDF